MQYISLKTIELLSFKMFHYSSLTNHLACTIISALGNLSPSTSQSSLIFLYKTYSVYIAPHCMLPYFWYICIYLPASNMMLYSMEDIAINIYGINESKTTNCFNFPTSLICNSFPESHL